MVLEDRTVFSTAAYYEQAETVYATDSPVPVTTGHWPRLSPD